MVGDSTTEPFESRTDGILSVDHQSLCWPTPEFRVKVVDEKREVSRDKLWTMQHQLDAMQIFHLAGNLPMYAGIFVSSYVGSFGTSQHPPMLQLCRFPVVDYSVHAVKDSLRLPVDK